MIPHSAFQAESFLTDVLGARNVKNHGAELIHSCLLPFGLHSHGDRNPSASLNSEKLVYNCFTCGGGSLLWATSTILGIPSSAARRLIQENLAPSHVTEEQYLNELEKFWRQEEEGYTMPEYSEAILKPWMKYTVYLDERGISREVQREMKTGVNVENMDQIGKDWVVQPRLVIPHFFGGKLRGWSMRKLSQRQIGMKYKHSPSFPKEYTLYNWDNIVGRSDIIVVESPLSVLKLRSEGIHNVVATFGAQVNDKQASLLEHFDNVTVFPDGDAPGYRATQKLVEQLRTQVWVIDHGVVSKEDGRLAFNEKDAADYAEQELRVLLAAKTPAMLWRWEEEKFDGIPKMDKGKTRQGKTRRAQR